MKDKIENGSESLSQFESKVVINTPLKVKLIHELAQTPQRQHVDDAGLDLASVEDVLLPAGGGRALVRTGVCVEVPQGYAGLVCPRSGLAARCGVTVVNGPGVIDSGYRGELKVSLVNLDPENDMQIYAKDRIAQLLITPVSLATVEVVTDLSVAERSEHGFGSTQGFTSDPAKGIKSTQNSGAAGALSQ